MAVLEDITLMSAGKRWARDEGWPRVWRLAWCNWGLRVVDCVGRSSCGLYVSRSSLGLSVSRSSWGLSVSRCCRGDGHRLWPMVVGSGRHPHIRDSWPRCCLRGLRRSLAGKAGSGGGSGAFFARRRQEERLVHLGSDVRFVCADGRRNSISMAPERSLQALSGSVHIDACRRDETRQHSDCSGRCCCAHDRPVQYGCERRSHLRVARDERAHERAQAVRVMLP